MNRLPSAVPGLIDELVVLCTAAMPSVTVSDGPPLELNPGDYLAIGVDDVSGAGRVASADASLEWAHATRTGRNEAGHVTCVAVSSSRGDADLKACRDAVFGIVDIIDGMLAEKPTIETLGVWSAERTGLDLAQDQGPDGAIAFLTFRIRFKARI